MDPLVERFAAIASDATHSATRAFLESALEMCELHASKSKDYGTDEDPLANIRSSAKFGIPAWVGAVIRGHDKTNRIATFLTKGELVHESVEDSLLDRAVYDLIALVLYRELHTAADSGRGPEPGHRIPLYGDFDGDPCG